MAENTELVLVAVDDCDHSERAFECKYKCYAFCDKLRSVRLRKYKFTFSVSERCLPRYCFCGACYLTALYYLTLFTQSDKERTSIGEF